MSQANDRITLDYRPRPPGGLAGLWGRVNKDKLIETLIGVGWTITGTGLLLALLVWVFVDLSPGLPAWRAWALVCLVLAFTGFAMNVLAVLPRRPLDDVLACVFLLTLLATLLSAWICGPILLRPPAGPSTAPIQVAPASPPPPPVGPVEQATDPGA